jgi:two-component system response regulator HydG
MKSKLLIVEDQFIEANNLKIILKKAGYAVCPIARSVPDAVQIVDQEQPDMVLLDIFLDGPQTGIDLAHILRERGIAFVFLSANSNKQTLNAAKATNPYGFLVKPFRERDVLVMLYTGMTKVNLKQEELPTNNN